jgi:alkanesulfonate monooxygenase SsuD/methylene tetrahydromethanopterin reductase-like flavin-dependent oxidoreductase (luciferase family)
VWDVENDTAYDPARIRPVDHQGQYFSVFNTPSAVHPSPQRTPALFQAGVSKAGLAFAAENAEGIFCASFTPERVATYTKSIRERAVELGRDPQDIKFFPGVTLFVAPTLEEAQAKFDAVAALATPEAGLAKFGGFTSIDCSKYPMDEPFEFEETDADNQAKGSILSFKDEKQGTWTPRKLGLKMALGSTYPNIIGTPEMVCDELERWVEVGDVDGFSLYSPYSPFSFSVTKKAPTNTAQHGVFQEPGRTSSSTSCRNCKDVGSTGSTTPYPAGRFERT